MFGLSLAGIFCTNRSAQMQAYYQCSLIHTPSVRTLPQSAFVSRSIMNWTTTLPHPPPIASSHCCRSVENIFFVMESISSSSFERRLRRLCVFRNPAQEKFPALHFSFLLLFRVHPNHPTGSWSVCKRWQHRVGLLAYLRSITLLILSAILQISDETGYCFWSLY